MRVEVNSDGLGALAGGASVTNTSTGNIDVQRGNITLAAMSVNQMGMASATTSVNLNGSIYLKATSGATKPGANATPQASKGGTLVLGEGSSTTILPTLEDTATAAAAPRVSPSRPRWLSYRARTLRCKRTRKCMRPRVRSTSPRRQPQCDRLRTE